MFLGSVYFSIVFERESRLLDTNSKVAVAVAKWLVAPVVNFSSDLAASAARIVPSLLTVRIAFTTCVAHAAIREEVVRRWVETANTLSEILGAPCKVAHATLGLFAATMAVILALPSTGVQLSVTGRTEFAANTLPKALCAPC